MLVDPSKSLLLHYAQLPAFPPKARYSIPTSLILDVKDPRNLDYEVWGGKGFRDLGIDICEADVPAQFTENFDWQDMRRHLVCGVLMSELLGKRIGVYKVGAEIGYSAPKDDADKQESTDQAGHSDARTYVERIRDTRTFADVSRDVLRRWSFPLVPDSGILGAGDFELRRGGIYVARDGVVLARTTSLSGPLLLGPSTYLATNTSVRRSVLGRNNRVAARTTICDSYLFDNVIVGKNCKIEGCIIGDDVVLEDGVTIEKGALLGNGVRVGQGQTIEAFARVGKTAKMTPCIEGDEEEAADEQDEGE
jgi:translation initiation factor eIF-2B subunit epsilon